MAARLKFNDVEKEMFMDLEDLRNKFQSQAPTPEGYKSFLRALAAFNVVSTDLKNENNARSKHLPVWEEGLTDFKEIMTKTIDELKAAQK